MEYARIVFSALSDPIRLRAMALIAAQDELCVCELTQALQVSQPTISKHMAVLRDAGLVKDRRDAQWVLYSLAADLPQWAADARRAAVNCVLGTAAHQDDVECLQAMTRPSKLRAG